MNIKTTIIMLIVLSFILAVFYDMNSSPITETSKSITSTSNQKEKAPEIRFTTISGENINLKSLQGKIVLLNFWASWCAPCVQEFPAMIKLAEKFDGQVILLAISKDSKKEHIDRFLKRFPKISSAYLKIIWDKNKNISEQVFNTLRVPETIIIDQKSFMVRKVIGASPIWESPEILNYIKELLKRS